MGRRPDDLTATTPRIPLLPGTPDPICFQPGSVRRLGHGDERDGIGHEAIRQNLDFKGAAPLSKKFEFALVILNTEKGRLSSISTLSDVMGKTWYDDASYRAMP